MQLTACCRLDLLATIISPVRRARCAEQRVQFSVHGANTSHGLCCLYVLHFFVFGPHPSTSRHLAGCSTVASFAAGTSKLIPKPRCPQSRVSEIKAGQARHTLRR